MEGGRAVPEADEAAAIEEVQAWAAGLQALHTRIAGRFARAEPRQRALDAGVPASWVTADEAYGGDPALRGFLEGRGVSYVLAVKRTELLAIPGPGGRCGQAPSSWLLVRRSRADGRLAFYTRFGPTGTLPTRPGPGGREPLGVEEGRPGPLPGPPLAGLAPPRHPGPAGARVPGTDRTKGDAPA